MVLAALVSVPAGMYFLVAIDAQVMRIVMSISVLTMVGLLATGWQYKGIIGPAATATGGLVGGLVQGAAGVGGPPIVTLLMSKGDEPRRTRGNIIIAMGSLLVIALPAQYFYGLFHAEVVVLAVLLAPVYVLSTYMGSMLFRKTGGRHYRKGTMALLAITAVSTLIGSLL
jgi:uncharacterized membrane protein YfcA